MNAPRPEIDVAGALAPVLIGMPDPTVPVQIASPDFIGFKAHNLARMASIGLPVPPAFVLATAWCEQPEALSPTIWQPALAALEAASDARFGDARRPLLVSVRSGAPVSMPGMMETLLNIGLSDATLPGLVRMTGNPRMAWDAYRRLVASYGEIVMGVDSAVFDDDIARIAAGRNERELDFAELRALTRAHQASIVRTTGQPFPQDPSRQLQAAIRAVFASWNSGKARAYRQLKSIGEAMGTAVTVQRMVFGNAGGTSGAGVGFTRHPSTGEPQPWVDFLFNAQGEDVVSGRRTALGHDELATVSPQVWSDLLQATRELEHTFADMQDFEFTVENGRLWMLQTRAGKRTPQARARIALDMMDEGLIDTIEAKRRTADMAPELLAVARVVSADGQDMQPIANGVSAANGVATGEIALDEARTRERHEKGIPTLLVRQDAETRDVAALEMSAGLLTARGARTSHAAVVARQLGKVCLVGCGTLTIDLARRLIRLSDVELAEGEQLTLDGNTGAIYRGEARTVREIPPGLLERLQQLRQTG